MGISCTMPKLQISLPDGSQLDHELTEETITIGRASDNTVELNDASMSGHHAQIAPGGESYIFTDLGSTNGSKINGTVCEPNIEYGLSPGDKILLGKIPAVYDPENATEDTQELPVDNHVAPVAKSSVKPSNFMNASPFQKRTTKKDKANMAIISIASVALLVTLAVTAMIFTMSPS
jgi:pSer/pThr/pTyr-binding forkhead associated (FHA) protein